VDVLTLYVGQGALAALRVGNEAVIIDSHMPDNDHVTMAEIKQSLEIYLRGKNVRGFMLTGFDADHAHVGGVEWILDEFEPDWVMYPKYYKDTKCADAVFNAIARHERKRRKSTPLTRHSVRIDKLDSRIIPNLGRNFSIELFSPHIQDMDSSNNCSIVARINGTGAAAFTYLATGDTETDRWETINKLFGSDLASDVLAAPHHGALSGTHAKALLSISPNTVLISAGVDSQYDHPHGAAIKAYQAVAEHVFATNGGGTPQNLLTTRSGSDFSTRVFGHAEVAAH
jgi:beta-lactamase superfamily II metal-dependent hydrolase